MIARLWPLLALVWLTGCENPSGQPAHRPPPLPDSLSPELSCHVAAPLPPGGITAVDTSLTPRADFRAETLALEASGEFIAPQALYERVAEEVRLLRYYHSFPVVGCAGLGTSGETDFVVSMTDAGVEQVESGQYTAWDDYNAALRVNRRITYSDIGDYRFLFDGIYNVATLEEAYGQLPEVEYAYGNEVHGFFGIPDACLERFGDARDTHVYIIVDDNGYYGYAAPASGGIEYLGTYAGGTPPDWFTKARICRNFFN